MEFILILVTGIVVSAGLGLVAFFRTLGSSDEITSLRSDLNELRKKLDDVLLDTKSHNENFDNAGTDRRYSDADITAAVEPHPESAPSDISNNSPATPALPQVPQPTMDSEAVSTQPQIASDPSPSKSADGNKVGNLEQSLAGNWLVWLGGITLALGGAFLVKSAIDVGFFGPVIQVLAGIFAGFAMIAASEWLRRSILSGSMPNGIAPAMLAAAGGSTIYSAIYAAHGVYHLVSPLIVLLLLAVACLGLIGLAVVHRAALVANLGLVGAFISPILTSSGSPEPEALFLYILMVSAAGHAVAQIMHWRSVSYTGLVGGAAWPLLWILAGNSSEGALALGIYLPIYLAMSVLIAADDAKYALDPVALLRRGLRAFPVGLAASFLAAASVFAIAFLFALKEGLDPVTVSSWGALLLVGIAAAWRWEGFSPLPILGMVGAAAALAFAPTGAWMPSTIGSVASALFVGGAVALQFVHNHKTTAASLFAFGPMLILMALFWRISNLDQGVLWGVLAACISLANLYVLTIVKARPGSFNAMPGVSAGLALGASLGAAMSVAMATDALWMSVGLAAQVPVLAWLWQRFTLPVLKLSAMVLALCSTARLLFLPEAMHYDVGAIPIFNALILGYLLPAIGFWFGARQFEASGVARMSGLIQTLEATAFALLATFVSLQIRHIMNAGHLDADFDDLLEISLHVSSWVLLAAGLRWRFGFELTSTRVFAERSLLLIASMMGIATHLLLLNPWWGNGPDIPGTPVLNLLLLTYGLPAAAFVLAAISANRAGAQWQARALALISAIFVFVWIILSIRQAFHAPDLSRGSVGNIESWAYSLITISYATLLLVGGAVYRRPAARLAGLGVLFFAITKVFLIDIGSLGGFWRATSFIGLGAALIGIAVFHQRVLAPMTALPAKEAKDN